MIAHGKPATTLSREDNLFCLGCSIRRHIAYGEVSVPIAPAQAQGMQFVLQQVIEPLYHSSCLCAIRDCNYHCTSLVKAQVCTS